MTKYLLIMVEGYTEVEFYEKSKQMFFSGAKTKIINLKGNFNINKKILGQASDYSNKYSNKEIEFSIAICIDRESRDGQAPIDLDYIKKEAAKIKNVNQNEIFLYEAIQDIESLFFYDIDGIYGFLRAPHTKRTCKYIPVEKYNHRDLSKLFSSYGKLYRKGDRVASFIDNIDLNKIFTSSRMLSEFLINAKKY